MVIDVKSKTFLEKAQRHHRAGRLSDAEALYREVLQQDPDHPEALLFLGLLRHQQGQGEEALDLMRRAITRAPTLPHYHCNLAVVLTGLGQAAEAIEAYRQALTLQPHYPEAHLNLGILLKEQGAIEEAITHYRRAIDDKPDLAPAYNGLGNALRERGDYSAADTAFLEAMRLDTGSLAHWNHACLALLLGNFTEGWKHYDWRFKLPSRKPRTFNNVASWKGEPLAGRSILLWCEQGFGDSIQFARYIKLVKQLGARVILECPPKLNRLFLNLSGIDRMVTPETKAECHYHAPLLSLPGIFRTNMETIPADIPYLYADAAISQRWQERLSADSDFRAGLVWAGNPDLKNDRQRSLSLEAFAPFAALSRVTYYSLQKSPAATQAKSPPPGLRLVDYTDELDDFADTAALIANLDLVITVDTSVAHLAGALGKPVWTLLPRDPDWRWLLEREDSPWYPTMRLFRQSVLGDWGPVIQRITTELTKVVNRR